MAVQPAAKTIEQVIKDTASKTTGQRKVGELGKDDFLNLMMTQLKYQDPMNPTDDKAFIGEMAQFSSLEQMQNMNQSMATVRATTYLGKNVQADFIDSATMETKHVDGVATDVALDSGNVVVIVNGVSVPVEKINKINDVSQSNPSTTSTISDDISKYTGFIGFNVKGKITDKDKNEVALVGNVTEVSKDTNGMIANLNNVKTDIISFAGETSFKGMQEKTDYLNSQIGKDFMVTVSAGLGKYLDITGKLNSFTADDMSVKSVTLDNIKVPIDSISSVMGF